MPSISSSSDKILDSISRTEKVIAPERWNNFQDVVINFLSEHKPDEEDFLQKAYSSLKERGFNEEELLLTLSIFGGGLEIFGPMQTMRDAVAEIVPSDDERAFFKRFIEPLVRSLLRARANDTTFSSQLSGIYGVEVSNVLQDLDSNNEEPPVVLDDLFAPPKPPTVAPMERGEIFDYGNLTKQAWGKIEQDFINRNIAPDKRGRMTGLLLPGIECHELDRFLELGFLPENLVVVEGGSTPARKLFRENAAKRGVPEKNIRTAKLEDIIADLNGPFDVVSLDFLGPMCRTYHDIITQLPLADDALVLLNIMAHRDNRKTQDFYRYLYEMRNRLEEKVFAPPFLEKLREEAKKESPTLADLRDNLIHNALQTSVGIARKKDIDRHAWPSLDLFFTSMIAKGLADNIKILRQEASQPPLSPDELSNITHQLVIFLSRIIGELPFGLQHESFQYLSPVNNTKIRYISDFVHVSSQSDIYRRCGNTVKFMRSIHNYFYEKFKFRKDGQAPPDTQKYEFDFVIRRRNEKFSFVFKDPQTKFELILPINQFFADFRTFNDRIKTLQEQYPQITKAPSSRVRIEP